MTKAELIKFVSIRTEIDELVVRNVIEGALETIIDELENGGSVEIRNFGSFLVKKRGPRTARNMYTGKPVYVPAKYRPVFNPGTRLREKVNKSR